MSGVNLEARRKGAEPNITKFGRNLFQALDQHRGFHKIRDSAE